jgi:predicted nucleic acid-binding protein
LARENEKDNRVYLDTNVLANWLLLYRKPKQIREEAEKQAVKCMHLLDRIRSKHFSCSFLVSAYAVMELSQTARDNLIALKIIRDGFSLNWFNRLKKRYELLKEEQEEIEKAIESFEDFLDRYGLVHIDVSVDIKKVNRLILKYGIETHDAVHVYEASNSATYLATIDPDLLNLKSRIVETKVVHPSSLETIRQLRAKKR